MRPGIVRRRAVIVLLAATTIVAGIGARRAPRRPGGTGRWTPVAKDGADLPVRVSGR